MNKNFFDDVEMFGYLSGETAFEPAFTRACNQIPGFQDSFESEIMAPLIEVAQDTNQSGVLVIYGLSDRVDTPGLSREEIRNQEAQASLARVVDARESIFSMLNDRLGGVLGGGGFGGVPNIALFGRGIGACVLVNSGSPLSEAERQRNRRIQLSFVQFTP